MKNKVNFINLDWIIVDRVRVNFIYICIIFSWVCEWAVVFEYLCGEYYSIFLIFPFKITYFLIIGIIYWAYLWGLAGWRRTQYGRFTKNERQLWVKSYASFWIIEFITIISFIIIFVWLSWGPLVLILHYFMAPRKGLMLEFIFYSYLIFFTYMLKLNMRWNLGNFQLIISLIVVILLSYLLWRDIIILFTRDNMLIGYGSQWRNIKLTGLVYALTHEWWIMHMLENRSVNFKYGNLNNNFLLKKYPFKHVIPLMEYELNLWLNRFWKDYKLDNMYLYCKNIFRLTNYYEDFDIIGKQSYFYPRRVGFIPKRLAIWEFLLFLKMWHQLIILLWWILYIFRIKSLKLGSYQLLAICQFNIYCCYILGLLIYLISYFVLYEMVFRFRPGMFSVFRFLILCKQAQEYYLELLWNYEIYQKKNEILIVFLEIYKKWVVICVELVW